MQTISAPHVIQFPAWMARGATRQSDTRPASTPNEARRSFAKEAGIFAQGDQAQSYYRVMAGTVRTYRVLSDGRRQIDAFHVPGDIFGIETGGVRSMSADAVEPVTLLQYRNQQLAELATDDPEFVQQVMGAMLQSLERAQAHIMLLGRKSAVEKLATFLLGISDRLSGLGCVDLPMSRIDIADHLGLTIETVSRSLTQLERARYIELPAHRRSIILKNISALRRLDS
ncbi:CRP/FNR family transcriptional regulator, nitrogen fixation regulation protein [Bosea sp. OK403]|uniref:helix-turn-helix domain-containing protein n=1 Tax=Bosea sp. OK403 TaxID=1855286 RepID=UPI0008E956D6|nr:helix-turn-helix domain-containing protein [Bosea sp. OK403]SFI13090.1 CRP/FNR family transcriptional regulator, nitrogen fixation regulation protein [Bosea sp. OK403]